MPLSSSVSFFLFFIFRKFLASREFSPKSFWRFLLFQTLVSYKVVSYKKKYVYKYNKAKQNNMCGSGHPTDPQIF